MATLLIVIHGILLVPTYTYLEEQVQSRTQQLATLTSQSTASNEGSSVKKLAALQANAAYLDRFASTPSASAVIQLILSVPHPGISLIGFTYTPASSSGTATTRTATIQGIATSRDTLRSYDLALQSMAGITTADLPISAYAQESDINFTINLSGSFMSP
jgi:Tfp pilus assembly protein PilN